MMVNYYDYYGKLTTVMVYHMQSMMFFFFKQPLYKLMMHPFFRISFLAMRACPFSRGASFLGAVFRVVNRPLTVTESGFATHNIYS